MRQRDPGPVPPDRRATGLLLRLLPDDARLIDLQHAKNRYGRPPRPPVSFARSAAPRPDRLMQPYHWGARSILGRQLAERTSMTSQQDEWRELGQQLRVDSIRSSSAAAGSGHPTSSMSAADLMAVLMSKYLRYDFGTPDDPRNDHLIFSKGHASPLLYAMYKAAGADRRRRAADLPRARQPARGPPHAGPAVGRRGDRLARPGPADRRRHRAGRQAAGPAPVPGLGPVRRQRDGRGLDVGGVRARRPTTGWTT